MCIENGNCRGIAKYGVLQKTCIKTNLGHNQIKNTTKITAVDTNDTNSMIIISEDIFNPVKNTL